MTEMASEGFTHKKKNQWNKFVFNNKSERLVVVIVVVSRTVLLLLNNCCRQIIGYKEFIFVNSSSSSSNNNRFIKMNSSNGGLTNSFGSSSSGSLLLTPKKGSVSSLSTGISASDVSEELNIPPNEWVARVMQKHPDILELRERIRPINNTKSYSRHRACAKTEASHVISDQVLLKLIMQYLYEENLSTTLNKIQEECNVKFIPHEIEKEGLPTLLRIGIKEANNWFGALEESWEVDPEVQAYHAYVSDQDNDLEEQDKNIWDDLNDTSRVNMTKNIENNTIQAATLNKLIWWLATNPNATDTTEFKKIFFLTYPSFTTAETILSKLIQIYNSPTKEHTDKGMFVIFLNFWIEQQPQDFNEKLLANLNNFIDNQMVKDGLTQWAKKLRTSIAKTQEVSAKKKEPILKDPPEPKVPKNIFSSTLTFDDIDEEEIARQLCLIDFQMYESIKSQEFLIRGWNKPQYRSKAPNLLAMMRRFNDFTKWVASCLLSEQQTKGKSKLLAKFLKISEHLKSLSNFHSLMAIFGGINNTLVWRTKAVRKDLSKQQQETYADLEKLFHSDQNFKAYRLAYKDAKPPCIPFLNGRQSGRNDQFEQEKNALQSDFQYYEVSTDSLQFLKGASDFFVFN
ncbi:Ras guanine nucleotide exchange factor [Heterostelium album PN500]|uniref:Ras guanine nucleotide exchange factor n=1 Tax=Heterostelium pallidum (strain ATCC 26659 / Pp 5 / PN500) TaxID=670386 RepID=D3BKS1_HETP5|nr:Ras guanine nucleotide exchange factor [Heterostelium album PN500]EFA78501.1 Ras guanine nucleotide exchange factor [Heterostelium album PN500]|eukprot:XP_020430625.1 Ras guanine nucleotide exchange factor [Heterostelium album PN500]